MKLEFDAFCDNCKSKQMKTTKHDDVTCHVVIICHGCGKTSRITYLALVEQEIKRSDSTRPKAV